MFNKNKIINIFYYIILFLIIIVLLGSILIILKFIPSSYLNNDFYKLLAPIGIMLSALLASLSVLKSISNTNRIEQNKKVEEEKGIKNRLEFYFNQMKFILYHYKLIEDGIKNIENIKSEKSIDEENKLFKDIFDKLDILQSKIYSDSSIISIIDSDILAKVETNIRVLKELNLKETLNNSKEKNLSSQKDEIFNTLNNFIILIQKNHNLNLVKIGWEKPIL